MHSISALGTLCALVFRNRYMGKLGREVALRKGPEPPMVTSLGINFMQKKKKKHDIPVGTILGGSLPLWRGSTRLNQRFPQPCPIHTITPPPSFCLSLLSDPVLLQFSCSLTVAHCPLSLPPFLSLPFRLCHCSWHLQTMRSSAPEELRWH